MEIHPDKVALYIRWSTDDHAAGTTLDVQMEGCRPYALSQGRHVRDDLIFIGDGYSGSSLDRPAFTRLRRAQEGCWAAGRPPYAYRKDDGRRLTPRPEEAQVVARIIREYITGKGSGLIAPTALASAAELGNFDRLTAHEQKRLLACFIDSLQVYKAKSLPTVEVVIRWKGATPAPNDAPPESLTGVS